MPSPTWIGLNVFRLIAVAFMAWAFVAQFLSLADEVTPNRGRTTDTPSASTTAFASPTATITEWKAAGSMTLGGSLGTPAMAAGAKSLTSTTTLLPSFIPYIQTNDLGAGSTSTFNALQRVPRPASPTISTSAETTTKVVQPLVGPVGELDTRNRARGRRRVGISGNRRAGYGTKSDASAMEVEVVEREVRTDLGVWMVISRLVISGLLALGIAAQLGIPETFLHGHLGWLGAQSTPLPLGGLQALCSIEILRVNAQEINLIPGYALLGIGLLNAFLGLALLYLSRHLPKSPPAPLYFHHAQRLLYWKPEPPFYSAISAANIRAHQDEEQMGQPPQQRIHKGRLPRSNAHEIGLEETDTEDEDDKLEDSLSTEKPRYIDGARALSAEEDVTRGGYPTFAAGSHIGQPGRHVPAGTLEHDRRGVPVRFNREEEISVNVRVPDTRSPERRQGANSALPHRRDSAFDDIQADLVGPARASRISDPTESSKFKKDKKKTKQRRTPSPPDLRETLRRAESATSDNSAYSGISRPKLAYRQSIDQAAKDLGPHFPPPPIRHAQNRKQETVKSETEHIKGDKPTPAEGRRPPTATAYLARAPMQMEDSLSSISAPAPREGDTPAPVSAPSALRAPSASQMPTSLYRQSLYSGQHIPSATDQKDSNRQISASPEPLSATESEDDSSSPASAVRGKTRSASNNVVPHSALKTPQSSIKRASSADDTRGPRGVRFDLSSVKEELEIGSPIPSTPHTGLRIPGTNFRLALPSILSPAFSKMRYSFDSTNSILTSTRNVSETRPASVASVPYLPDKGELDVEGEVQKNWKALHRHSSAVLGGNYLVGGKETLK